MYIKKLKLKAYDFRHKKIFDVEALYFDEDGTINQISYVDDGNTEFDVYKPKWGYPSKNECGIVKEDFDIELISNDDLLGFL